MEKDRRRQMERTGALEIEEVSRGDAVILKPIGRLDSNTTSAMQERVMNVLARRPRRLVIDFAAVDYINSTGLRIMLMAAKKIKGD
ncbi:MAG: STAS domain-containing protein, partial [Geminicoccaceae bacterium]